jgi:molybdate transport system substrate-binding protein
MKLIRLSACCLLSLLVLAGCGRKEEPAAAQQLFILVPCGMEVPFNKLAEVFRERNPQMEVRVELEVAHAMSMRVAEGTRPDIIVSPGGVEIEPLVKQGLVDPANLVRFGIFDLMLFVPRANEAQVTDMDSLLQDSVKILAVADPETTSIGRFAKEALVKKGLWDRLQDKIIITSSASDTYSHVARAKADASFAYRSCPLKTAPDKIQYSRVRVLEEVPKDLYGPAYATAAILTNSPNAAQAKEFIGLLLSDEGRTILAEYDLPPPPAN